MTVSQRDEPKPSTEGHKEPSVYNQLVSSNHLGELSLEMGDFLFYMIYNKQILL